MFLGIEIGGTKLQFGVCARDGGEFLDFQRLDVCPERGAQGILEQISRTGRQLVQLHAVTQAGIGFGGPVDAEAGKTIKSHQVNGWVDFPLVDWCRRSLGVPAILGNDCDAATLAEARHGAGRGHRTVFYVTVGTGVGGGCVIDGQVLGHARPAIAEIGHLRPGLDAVDFHSTLESLASGWGIAAAVRIAMAEQESSQDRDVHDLLARCDFDPVRLTTLAIADAARNGNPMARRAIDGACRALGWGIAQVITLLAPEIVVVGGGVTLMGEELFLQPVRGYVRQYVFPPLARSFELAPAQLGEQVVVHGAIALAAAGASSARSTIPAQSTNPSPA